VNWERVQKDHSQAGRLIRQAEWALGIVSAVTLLISVWVSYVLPRQVIKPLLSLKEAVDHAAEGNYEIDFDVQGKGEIIELVESLRRLLQQSDKKHKQERIGMVELLTQTYPLPLHFSQLNLPPPRIAYQWKFSFTDCACSGPLTIAEVSNPP
jgi:methyl-accepting chemotaxis protein